MFANISGYGATKNKLVDGNRYVPNADWNDGRLNFDRSNVDNSWDNNGVRFSVR